jgi:hypothetical protein
MTYGEEFRAYMKAANRTPGNDNRHLSEAEMIAYCRGEGSEIEREAAQAHLVACEQCIALFRSASDFLEPEREDEKISTIEINQEWRSLSKRVGIPSADNAVAETSVVKGEFQGSRDKKFFLDSRITLAMAACLLISLSAVGWLTWRFWQERESRRQSQEVASQLERKQQELEQRLSQLEQSGGEQLKREREQRLAAEVERDRLQALIAGAQPDKLDSPVYLRLSAERGSGQELQLKIMNAAQVRLLINKPDAFSDYTVELLNQDGKVVRNISSLRPHGTDRALSFRLKRGTLSTGKYKLRLFGQEGKTQKQLGEYGLSVTVH